MVKIILRAEFYSPVWIFSKLIQCQRKHMIKKHVHVIINCDINSDISTNIKYPFNKSLAQYSF